MALPEQQRKLLWGRSGGVCALCKAPVVNLSDGKIIGEEAHIVTKNDKRHHRYKDIPNNEKDVCDNIVVLCESCHTKTDEYSIEELHELKQSHENFVKDTLQGHLRPYELGEGKFFNAPYVSYKKYEKPLNKRWHIFLIGLIIMGIIAFILLIYFFPSRILVDNISIFGNLALIILLVVPLIHTVIKLKQNKPVPYYKGKCTFVGCKGFVHIEKPKEEIRKKHMHIGICDYDNSHTFSVTNDLEKGYYEKLDIIHVTVAK